MSQKVKGVLMRNLRHITFIRRQDIGRFSNLHWCTFNAKTSFFAQCYFQYRYLHQPLSLCTRAPRLSSMKKRSNSVNVTEILNGLNSSRNGSIRRSREIYNMLDKECECFASDNIRKIDQKYTNITANTEEQLHKNKCDEKFS